jgi:thiol-disulfide isomerase/thioredoxin
MNKILFFLFVFISLSSVAQKIKLKVSGEKDTTVFLVKYYGKGMYYADTAIMKNGFVEFNGKKQKPGVYALLLSGQKYFDFLYNNEEVVIETTSPEFIPTMRVKKSIENTIFLDYVQFMNEKRTKAKELSEQREKLKKEDVDYKRLTTELEGLSKEVATFQRNLAELHKNKLVGKIVKMSTDIEIPEAPKNSDGTLKDSSFAYKYFRTHYFDNIDLNDDNMLNTPIFHNKLEFYFGNNMMVPVPDSIIKYAFDFIDRLNPKSELFKYSLTHITSTYEKSNIMGMDKVFVYMGEKYYCAKNSNGTSNITWMEDDKLKELCKKVSVNKNLVIGVRPPNLSLVDSTDNNWKDFYSIKSDFTILYFWDPECGHCKKTTPKLGELYSKKLKDRNVEVFAVGKAVGEDFKKWKDFIKEHKLNFINVALTEKLYSAAVKDARLFVPKYTTVEALNYQDTYDVYATPKVFVLDKDKKIIAKGLSLYQIEEMLDHFQNKKDAPKILEPDKDEEEHAKETH